ncbi:hypothetical protein EC991_006819 [Linnemannia zychae]|nr:hypothetical protein EC991_006819 [Linnemannia zychae]
MDRTTMRGLDSSSSEEDLDDDDDDASEEQSESDSDRRRFSSQQHLPVSVKRRKVSVDEDYEGLQLLQQADEIETRPTNIPLLGACRKRTFEDAIELTRPLGNDPSIEHAGWLGSIKRRKIHHFPTRWTSTLSPSPYIKLLAMRDFWDVMMSRMDLSWLNLWTASGSDTMTTLRKFDGDSGMEEGDGDDEEEVESDRSSMGSDVETEGSDDMDTEQDEKSHRSDCKSKFAPVNKEQQSSAAASGPVSKAVAKLRYSDTDQDITGESTWAMYTMLRRKKRTVVQHPSAALFLRGLWEEEEHCRRLKQMIPEGVHKPLRSKVLNRKPLPRTAAAGTKAPSSNKSQSLNTGPGSSTLKDTSSPASELSSTPIDKESSSTPAENSANEEDSSSKSKSQEGSDTRGSTVSNEGDQDMVLRKKYGSSSALRSNALSEGYDLNEYKPWKDATITPHQGCIQTLRKMRCTMLEPWPVEESRAKDECSRILHVMREQLNVVINLQIHLRSMIKTAPQQMSFLLSIRHPGQISIELLNALYGPQFMQTNAFRSIEQLLWGKNYCWKTLDSSSALPLQHHRPPAQLARYSSSSSSSQESRNSYSQEHYQQRQQYSENSYHDHEVDDEHDSVFDSAGDVHHHHLDDRHHGYQDVQYQDHHDSHDGDYEHQHQYPRHHDHKDQLEYQNPSQSSYYEQHHHHSDHQQYSSPHHYHQDDVVHSSSSSSSSSLRYSRAMMEDVSECEFEEEFDEPPYQDSLLAMDSIAHSENDKTMAVQMQQDKEVVVMVTMDGGYESGGDVSEGEIEALEITSSSMVDASTFH